MTIKKRQTFFVFFTAIASVLVSTGFLVAATKPTTSASTVLYRPAVSTSTQIGFDFQMGTLLQEGSYAVITLDPGITPPAVVNPADAKITIDGVMQNVGAVSGPNQFGYEINGSDVRVTLPTDLQIAPGSEFNIILGQQDGYITPGSTGSLLFTAKFYDSLDQYIGGIQMASFIAPPLSVSGTVDTDELEYRVVRILPELRVGPPLTNNAATYFVSLRYGDDFLNQNVSPRTANQLRAKVIVKDQTLSQVGQDGSDGTTKVLKYLIDTSYDVGIKTDQHLTRILRNIPMSKFTVTDLNFTDPLNGPALGSQVLLAGDINKDGLTPDTLGDDVINSIDLSLRVQVVDATDPSKDVYRANLNKDDVVNSVDLSIMLKNLDQEGDK